MRANEIRTQAQTPTPISSVQQGHESERMIVFEGEDTLESLGRAVASWIADHDDYEVVSLSHAAGTRHEKSYEEASFGRTKPVSTYSAMLLVRPATGDPGVGSHRNPEPYVELARQSSKPQVSASG